jgi:hypothetical protein
LRPAPLKIQATVSGGEILQLEEWAPQVRSGSDPTRVALPMLWLRRGSSVGQSTALVRKVHLQAPPAFGRVLRPLSSGRDFETNALGLP